MIHMSLFSGIGGFELAAEWMGWDNMVSCEINDFGRKVLDYYWPNSYHHDDIHTLTYDRINEELTQRYGASWRSDDIILTGGFPCQPYSAAGKRLGNEDDRHLWPQMLRIIREVRPTWVVGENVLGLVNWNDGLVFHEVQAELEAEGYEVQPYVLPAAGVGAPHRRDRVWFVAYSKRSRTWGDNGAIGNEGRRASKDRSESIRQAHGEVGSSRIDATSKNGITPDTHRDGHDEQSKTGNNAKRKNNKQSGTQRISTIERPCNEWDASDPNDPRLQTQGAEQQTTGPFQHGELGGWDASDSDRQRHEELIASTEPSQSERLHREANLRARPTDWRDFPTEPPIRSKYDGLSSELVGITVSKHRNESIKAYGNAIVPQVAHQIFKAIQQYKDQQP
jgi:DNA (cytosine-5)-methyltransferase 1